MAKTSVKRFRLGYTLAILFGLGTMVSGCDPYGYYMGEQHLIACRVITSLHSVEQGKFVSTLRDTGAVNLSYFGATQYKIKFDARLDSGQGMRVMLRPVVEQWYVRDSGIVVSITPTGSSVDSGGKTFLRNHKHMDVGATYPFVLISENNYTALVMGCDTVYSGLVRMNESDDIVIQSLPKSVVRLINPDWGSYQSEQTEY